MSQRPTIRMLQAKKVLEAKTRSPQTYANFLHELSKRTGLSQASCRSKITNLAKGYKP